MKPRYFSPFITSTLKKCFTSNASQIAGAFAAVATLTAFSTADAAIITWGGATGADFGVATNWVGGVLPSAVNGDTAVWDGSVSGNLSLVYATGLQGAAGNPGVNLSVTAGQTSNLTLDSTVANTTVALRMNNLSIASGAGAVTFGNAANTFPITVGGTAGQTHTWTNESANLVTFASDATIGLGGGGAHTFAIGGAGSWRFNKALPSGTSIAKSGAGTLTLNPAAAMTTGGTLTIDGGVVQTTQDLIITGLSGSGSGTLESGQTAAKWMTFNMAADTTYSGTIRTNPNNAAGTLGLVKQGVGKLNLTGNVTHTVADRLSIENGTIRLAAGTYNAGYAAGGTNQTVQIGSVANQNGILQIDGGTFNALRTVSPTMNIGGIANSRGFVNMTSGALNSAGELHIGNGAGGYGALTMSGGAVTSGSWLVVAANNDRAVLNQSGGTLAVNTGTRITVGAGGTGSIGVLNLSGGTLTSPTGIFVGENGTGIANISGSGALNVGNLQFAGGGGLAGTVNLLGGTVNTGSITKGTGTGVYLMNFNGGTLQPTASNSSFFDSLANTSAYVYGGGALINSNGYDITVGQPLLAPTGSGVTSIASFTAGAGYVDQPVVTVVRGTGDTTGVGATAVATVAGGVVTGITITNPGVGYTATPTFTVSGGGATTAATITGAAPAANTSGGLTKSGAGALTLSGANTYTGATTVNGGTLNVTGSLDASSTVSVAAGAALSGSGSVGGVTLADSSTSGLGNSSGGVLTTGNVTFNGAAALNLNINPAATTAVVAAQTVTTGAVNSAGKITVNASALSWNSGDYNLLSYTSLAGTGASVFTKGSVTGLSNRQTATLKDTGSAVALTIAGDNPAWTGAAGGDWTTTPGNQNWYLTGQAATTDFITGDIVTFDDTASNSLVNIAGSNVSPLSTIFNNSTLPYTISSLNNYGIASGSVAMNGAGSVTMATANTYAGGTVVNAGTLNLNNASAIGSGGLTLGANASIDNTSGAPITLSTNNVQTWNGATVNFLGSYDLNLGTGAIALPGNRTINAGGSATLGLGGVISGAYSLTKAGSGTLSLSGANTYTGVTVVNAGTLDVAGGATGVATTNVEVASATGTTAAVNVSGGVLNASRVILGGISGNNTAGGNATLNQTAGTINAADWFTVGSGMGAGSTAAGTFNMSGGVLNTKNQQIEVANFAAATGTINLSGSGQINLNNNLSIALGANNNAGNGTINQSGGSLTFYSNLGTTVGGTGQLKLGAAATLPGSSTYTYNLNGGVLTVPSVVRNAAATNLSSAVFNFNGGTLKAGAASATFLQGLTAANVQGGGALIDSNGFAITIGQALAGSGDLVKSGSGTLTLTGTDTYGGATTINAGTLVLSGTGSVNASTGINVNNGAKLLQLSSTASSVAVTLNNGTVDGTGSLGAVTVADGAGNVVANGNGTATALTVDSLTLNGAATLNLKVDAAAVSGLVVTNGLTTNGSVTVNATNSIWNNGQTYNLLSYGSLGGVGFSDFHKGTITGLSPRQVATLNDASGVITLSIAGDLPVWTGGASGEWSTATIADPKNWKLQANGTAIDYLNTDSVLFDDTALGNTSVTIDSAGVSPVSTSFNNSTKDYILTSSGTVGIATGFLTKAGTGSVTLSAANTYTGGTTVNNGTLNLNNASAIGTGALTLNGGALGNTSGADVTLTTTNAQNWNGDFTFNGTNNLNLGTGAVTLGGAGTVRTVAVNSGTLTVSSIPVATAGYSLSKTGSGTLSLAGAAVSRLAGDLDISGGKVQTGIQDLYATGLTGSGIVENGSDVNRWLYLNTATDKTFSGVIQNGAGLGKLGLNKSGVGTLTLTGANAYDDQTSVTNGKLVFSGTTNNIRTANVVGNTAGQNGVLEITSGSTFGANFATTQFIASLQVGSNATAAGSIKLDAGGTLNTSQQLQLGTGTGGYGAFTQHGGTSSFGSFLLLGANNDRSVANIEGGSLTMSNNMITVAAGGTGSIAVMNVSGGSVTSTATTGYSQTRGGVFVGEFGNGTLNVSGAGSLALSGWALRMGQNAGASGVVNLDGGTVTTTGVSKGAGTGTISFNGGALVPSADNATFMQGLDSAYVRAGGANINSNGHSINIAQPLLAPTGSGVSADGLVVSGGGYIDTPIVQITGGNGTGATAVATIDGSGNLTGIVMTNPGVGYTAAPTFALLGGGIGNTGALSGAATLVENASGGLAKTGAGTLTLSGANTYSGATSVNAGTLDVTGSLAAGSAVTVAQGATLGGTGTIAGTVNASGAIAPGVAGAGTLATGEVTVAGSLAIEVNGAVADKVVSSGAVHLSGALSVTELAGGFTEASYVIAEGASLTGAFSSVPTGYKVTYTETTATLAKQSAAGYDSWATAQGLDATNNGPTQDPDGDGISNVLEFVLGGNPLASDTSILPVETLTETDFIFTFNRADESESQVTLSFESGSDLAAWPTTVAIGATSSNGVTVTENDANPDTVTVTIPRSNAVDGKLFGRLNATKQP